MTCPTCSTKLPPNAIQCISCGAEVDPLLGQSLLDGQFIIRRKIARGGFGVVYEAEQPTVGGKAAIKVLQGHLTKNPDIVARFQREGIVARRLVHPAAVKVYNLWKSADGSLWIAMEFLEGITVEERLCQKAFSPDELVEVLGVVCEVLQEAHQKKILHRDLNTKNLMLMAGSDGKYTPKVIDFGIAEAPNASVLHDTGVIMGTPAFMAPEQFRGLKFADPRSDIYSLGIIAYRMLSRRFPFDVAAGDAMAWMYKHTSEKPKPLREVMGEGACPEALEDAILKALEKDPAQRFSSALEFGRALEAAVLRSAPQLESVKYLASQPRVEEIFLPKDEEQETDPFIGTRIGGAYLLHRKLGEGSLGAVYEASKASDGARVAVKILYRLGPLDTKIEHLDQDLPSSRLKNPTVARVFDLGETQEGFFWIAQELIDDLDQRTLGSRLRGGRVLSLETSLSLLEALSQVLDEAHQAGVVHRGLRPQNIVLTPEGDALAKILDFETAGILDASSSIRSRTILGDPSYLAPEQFRGLKFADARSDIYALGLIAYRMLSGRLPFEVESGDLQGWMKAHTREEPLPLREAARDIPPALEEAVHRALEKEPARRFSSALEFGEALRAAAGVKLSSGPAHARSVHEESPAQSGVAGLSTTTTGSARRSLVIQTSEDPVEPLAPTETEIRNELVSPSERLDTAPPLPEAPLPPPVASSKGGWLYLFLGVLSLAGVLGVYFLWPTDALCGDGRLSPGEICDDGNTAWGDGCRADCRGKEICGDGLLDEAVGEACDDGNLVSGDGCRADCRGREECGDGLLDEGEECDDGNKDDNDDCKNDCTIRYCGNGTVDHDRGEQCEPKDPNCGPDCRFLPPPPCGNGLLDEGEECDDGNKDDNDDCLSNCWLASCGDGFVREVTATPRMQEECDDGNRNNNDDCTNLCQLPICGDGFVRAGIEECDDGNQDDTDSCLSDCRRATCGDGFVQAGVEECDDGNQDDTDSCLSNCRSASCGDGFVQAGVEECDDGNLDDTDSCLSDCRRAACGDGFVQAGVEECDDGNQDDTDSCLSNCQSASCGDGFVQKGVEECDDGNQSNEDACLTGCKKARCGDGFVQVGVEECDDGNNEDTDLCLTSCRKARCGDGFVHAGVEVCDDGNQSNTDACTNTCEAARCGDGFVQKGVEECDDGNQSNEDACLTGCKKARCGDGFVQVGVEECDDGNLDDNDGCRNTCVFPRCGDGIIDAGEECDTEDTCEGEATCQADCRCGAPLPPSSSPAPPAP